MYIITVAGKEKEGAYSVIDDDNEEVLYIFEEIEDEIMIKTCEMHGHKYTVITLNDIVIPPDTTDISHDNI